MKRDRTVRVPVPSSRYLGGSAGQSKGGGIGCAAPRTELKMKTKQ